MDICDRRPVYALTSPGLWKQRDDLSILLEADLKLWPLCSPSSLDGYVGWGRRISGVRARQLAATRGKQMLTLEDGFLKSYAPGKGEPPHSFVIDRRGIYFDASSPNDLQMMIDEGGYETGQLTRASAAIAYIRENRLSKYNNSPLLGLDSTPIPNDKPFVLLVDQVSGDASIAGALADEAHFGRMLEHARDHYPDASIVVRTHPAAGDRSLLMAAARKLGIDAIVPRKMNPWPLLEAADAVYTVSSQLGFEALMAGTQVHCFGVTYYSNRGLTQDHVAPQSPRKPASLERIFHAAYIDYSRYLDLHDRRPVTLETALEQIRTVRDQRSRIERRVYTGGLSPWKRRALTPFVTGPEGPPIHCARFSSAVRLAAENSGQVALWGSARPLPKQAEAVRFEDGFIRSRGLGANLALPCSLAMDGDHIYYDARGESLLERIIATHDFPPDLIARASKLVDMIVTLGVSKYNVGTDVVLPSPPQGRLRILVPGQVEKDASIRLGSPNVRTNHDLVAAVRQLYPDAFLAYKEHPDVTTGLRSGGQVPEHADVIVREGDIKSWIDWCDRLETMTSLAGFEALIRDKPVGVHGIPFYAGWGLTDDRMSVPRRNRSVNRDMLAAAALILYPFYIHPLSAMPCSVEELVAEIALNRTVRVGALARFRQRIAQSINRSAVKIRDGKN